MSGWSSWPSDFSGYGHAGLIDSLGTSPYIGARCSGLERITTVQWISERDLAQSWVPFSF
jgi:hypothetical protein